MGTGAVGWWRLSCVLRERREVATHAADEDAAALWRVEEARAGEGRDEEPRDMHGEERRLPHLAQGPPGRKAEADEEESDESGGGLPGRSSGAAMK